MAFMSAEKSVAGIASKAKRHGSRAGRKAKRSADRGADKADDSRALGMLARVGYVVVGVLHLIIGWLAVRIAIGDSGGEEASNSGALAQIAEAPGGRLLLWLAVAGLAGLAIWRLIGIFVEEEAKDKAKSLVLAVVYASLAVTTSTFARGASTSDGDTASDITAKVLEQPMGVALVVAGGAVVLGVGLYSIWNGATKGFKDDLEAGAESGHVGSAIVTAGVVGYVARGLAFGILGVLIVMAAITNDPEKAAGLDSALRTLGGQPAGAAMLIVVGVGVALYGLYSIARARYVRR
ncbi:hypothetical protein CHAN_08960 [Corynebacterium hansenii]|nr:hypothetical protein CHAN_08960 [Corynebacterium hansenii]